MIRQTTLAPTSSSPAATPHQADSTNTSRGPSRRRAAGNPAEPGAAIVDCAGIVLLMPAPSFRDSEDTTLASKSVRL